VLLGRFDTARTNLLLGVLAIVVAVFFGVLGLLVAHRDNSSGGAVPSPSATPAPAQAIVEGWQRVAAQPGVFGNANLEQVTDVTFGDGTYVAVGAHNYTPAIWTAKNPTRWTRLSRVEQTTGASPSMISSVAYAHGKWIAVGQQAHHAAVWTSDDAVTWRLVPSDATAFGTANQMSEIWSVIRFRGAWYASGDYAAGGTVAQVAAVWRSSNGQHWTRLTLATESGRVAGDRPVIVHLATSGGRIVGVGTNDSLATGSQTCDIWTSADGTTWQAGQPARGSLDPAGQRCSLDSVVYAHNRFVAVGAAAGQGQAWTSTDGIHWVLDTKITSFTDSYGATEVNDVTATSSGWLAVGDDPGPDGVSDAAVWDSTTPKTWLRVHPEPSVFGGPDRQVMAAVVRAPYGAVAVGWDASSGNPCGAVWVQRPVGSS